MIYQIYFVWLDFSQAAPPAASPRNVFGDWHCFNRIYSLPSTAKVKVI